MPAYPAAMSSLPAPMMVPGRWQSTRVTAAVLCFVTLVLVLAGLFLPLYSGTLATSFSTDDGLSDSIELTLTPWALEFSDERLSGLPGSDVPRFGYPLVFAAVAIACAAAACWYAATPSAGRTAGRAAGVVTGVSGAFLLGVFWTMTLVINNGVDDVLLMGTLNEELETTADYLAGFWVLTIAMVLGVVAMVLSLIPGRQPLPWQPPPPVNPFVATPPFGIALPMNNAPQPGPPVGPVAPLTGQPVPPSPPGGVPVAQPLTVDPLTGEPLTVASPPTGVPIPAQPLPFTPEPVGTVNGSPAPSQLPAPVAPPANNEPAPVVIPDAPPLQAPPGPAIPDTEDPLAEPPRS